MSGRSFLDTNILIYAFADTGDDRHEKALTLVEDLLDRHNACLSVQVLKEFHAVATRKVRTPLSRHDAAVVIRDLCSACFVAEESAPQLQRSLDLMDRHRLSIWDASVVSAAEALGCRQLYTEDLTDGATIGTVRVANPLL